MKLYEAVTLVAGGLLVAWIGYGVFFESNIDDPPFKVIKKVSGIDIRQYEQMIWVSHTMSSENQSFRHLFRYIDGHNNENQKIPMTAPVIENNGDMMFVMPSTMANAPTPSNKDLQVKSMKTLKVAVLSFRGSANGAQKHREKLLNKLEKENIQTTGDWYLCQYNSPWVFPLFRKNEIWVEVN